MTDGTASSLCCSSLPCYCWFHTSNVSPLVGSAKNASCNIDEEILSHEIPIAKVVSRSGNPTDESRTQTTVSAAQMLHPPSHANLLNLYRFVMTMAIDTAKAERTFSTVKRLLTDNRRSTLDRLRHLVVLAHEKRTLLDIPMDKFIEQIRITTRRLLI